MATSSKANAKKADAAQDESAVKAASTTKKLKAKKLDPHQYVTVRNGYQGKLIFISPRTREKFVWDEFGMEQELELQDLRSARGVSRRFFEENWFLIDDPEVIEYLGVERFYRNAISAEEFETLFDKPVDEIISIVSSLSNGQKRAVGYLAKKKVADGEVDSIKLIDALEKEIGMELIER